MTPEVRNKLHAVLKYPFFRCCGKEITGQVTKAENWESSIDGCTPRKWRKWINSHLMLDSVGEMWPGSGITRKADGN